MSQALTEARKASIALMSLGVPRQDSVLMQQGKLVSWSELTALQAKGAVGDVNLRYFDRQGRAMASELNRTPSASRSRKSVVGIGSSSSPRPTQVQCHPGGTARKDPRRANYRLHDRTSAVESDQNLLHPRQNAHKVDHWRQYHGQIPKSIAVLATLDTKGKEAQFPRTDRGGGRQSYFDRYGGNGGTGRQSGHYA